MSSTELDRHHMAALAAEITSTRNLLAYGTQVIRTAPFFDATRDPILTMLSIGVEKLYKLTLGLIALDSDHKWPHVDQMKAWGHNLVPMHHEIMNELRARTASKGRYVRELVAEVDSDPLVLPVIEALDVYGRAGRFYYLDQLGDVPQAVSPEDTWQKIERTALVDPEVATLFGRAINQVGDDKAWDSFIRALNERIASAVDRVWIMIAMCGRNHAFGVTGTTFGFQVHPTAVGRQSMGHT